MLLVFLVSSFVALERRHGRLRLSTSMRRRLGVVQGIQRAPIMMIVLGWTHIFTAGPFPFILTHVLCQMLKKKENTQDITSTIILLQF